MSVGVVTDSACSLPATLAADSGVTVVPLHLTIGGESLRDGAVPLDVVVARLGEGVKTSGPAPGEFAAAVEAADAGDGVVVCTVSSGMSSTFDAARLAATLSEGARVEVVDSGTAAGGEGLVVLAAAEAARRGATVDEVAATARRVAAEVRLVATLPTLDHLARGGRVPGAAAWAGRWLGLSPIFEFRRGHVRPHRPARGAAAACERILSYWRDSLRSGDRLHVAVMHAAEPEAADGLMQSLRAEAEPVTAYIAPFSTVMVAHTGPGLVGLAWWWEPAGA